MGMKKVGALVMAGALLTMGGVYATWTFSETKVDGTNDTLGFGIRTETAATTEKGVYTIALDDTTTYFAVCQLGSKFVQDWYTNKGLTAPEGDTHAAVLLPNPTAEVVLTFTPSQTANESVRSEGIKTSWTYSLVHTAASYTVDGENKYLAGGTATNIFSLSNPDADDSAKQTITILPWEENPTDGGIHWERQTAADGTYYFTHTISAEHIVAEHIQLALPFIVDTKAAYEVFSTCVLGAHVRVDIAEMA